MGSSRAIVTGLALGRMALGAGLLVAPGTFVGRTWVGRDAKKRSTKLVLQAVGARDLGIGLGILMALRDGGTLKPLLLAASIADATDFAATLAAGDAVPAPGRVGVGVMAGGATFAQLALLRTVN